MYKIDFVTTARSDYSIWKPIFDMFCSDKRFEARMVITGTHFLSATGYTFKEIHRDIPVERRIDLSVQENVDPGKYMGEMLTMYSDELKRSGTEIVCLFGDRFEILPMLSAAVINQTIITHFYGGECDASYCIDNQVRDAVTKAAHIGIVWHADIKKRLQAMGEEEWRIYIAGARPVIDLDNIHIKKGIFEYLQSKGIENVNNLVNCCYHPPTTVRGQWEKELPSIFEALDDFPDFTYIWTGVNADPESNKVKNYIHQQIKLRRNHFFFDHLGGELYKSLLFNARFMIGNSSSGLVEAPIFKLPTVNVGSRQSGRLHGTGIFDCVAEKKQIKAAIDETLIFCRESIVDLLSNEEFPKNVTEHVYRCVNNKNIRIKRLLGVKYTLARVPEY